MEKGRQTNTRGLQNFSIVCPLRQKLPVIFEQDLKQRNANPWGWRSVVLNMAIAKNCIQSNHETYI